MLYSHHLEGMQNVENHLVHMGTSSYRCTHIITYAPIINFPLYGTHPLIISCIYKFSRGLSQDEDETFQDWIEQFGMVATVYS